MVKVVDQPQEPQNSASGNRNSLQECGSVDVRTRSQSGSHKEHKEQWLGFQVKVECVNVCESANRQSDLSAASGGISRNITVVSRRVGLSDTDVFGGPERFFFTLPPPPLHT